ncbi:hypothetical protein SADUNF_Sadunf11G0010800 [Salix dunnii]|uniref:Uncharacterized protein n=1 Tax=Salix dunnii TaxID=1413687 RepID=A0A835JJQ3_9ROSI|nr:hypothetical protein SADUNF_Sadunf11G0010800 [Salix dunnii]
MRTDAIYRESDGRRKQEIMCVLNSSVDQLLDLQCSNDHIFPKYGKRVEDTYLPPNYKFIYSHLTSCFVSWGVKIVFISCKALREQYSRALY